MKPISVLIAVEKSKAHKTCGASLIGLIKIDDVIEFVHEEPPGLKVLHC